MLKLINSLNSDVMITIAPIANFATSKVDEVIIVKTTFTVTDELEQEIQLPVEVYIKLYDLNKNQKYAVYQAARQKFDKELTPTKVTKKWWQVWKSK